MKVRSVSSRTLPLPRGGGRDALALQMMDDSMQCQRSSPTGLSCSELSSTLMAFRVCQRSSSNNLMSRSLTFQFQVVRRNLWKLPQVVAMVAVLQALMFLGVSLVMVEMRNSQVFPRS